MKNLIVIENDTQKEFDTKEELVKELITENYYNLTKKEQQKIMNDKAMLNCAMAKVNNLKFKDMMLEKIKEKIIIQDETTYILSLLRLENIAILEEKSANIFLKNIDKSKFENNYIVVNNCVEEILKNYTKN